MSGPRGFTGRTRKKKTTWSVRIGDFLSKWFITVGGIGTVVAVSTVFFLLLWVTLPLLRSADISKSGDISSLVQDRVPLHTAVDEYQTMGWTLFADGELVLYSLDEGEVLRAQKLFEDRSPTALAFSNVSSDVVAGFGDGSLAFGHIGFGAEFLDQEAAPGELKFLEKGAFTRMGEGVVQRISSTQFRLQTLEVDFEAPIPGESSSPVRLIDQSLSGTDRIFAVFHEDETFHLVRVEQRENMLTGEVLVEKETSLIPYEGTGGRGLPRHLALSGLGDSVILAWPDGHLARYNTRGFSEPHLHEELDLFESGDRQLTSLTWLLGRTTLMIGDSEGVVHGLFPARPAQEDDHRLFLVQAHRLKLAESPITSLATSSRTRMIAAGSEKGKVSLIYVTSHKELGTITASEKGEAVRTLAFAPKDDGFLAISGERIAHWKMEPGHPETTLQALFGPVWYEGAAKPEFVWQSTGGTDSFEPKLSLWPLVFGTLKATIYSLLFGVPIALLAAVFTSEFLNPRVRIRIKPVVELMASLPSVVLGFLAALVFAPVVADHLSTFLAMFLTVPGSFLLGAYTWQLLPHKFTLRFGRWRFFFMFLSLPVGLAGGVILGPVLGSVAFGGDPMLWLDSQIEGTAGAWSLLLLPLSVLSLVLVYGKYLGQSARKAAFAWSRARCAWFDLGRFAAGAMGALLLSGLGGLLLSLLGADPRGGIFDTYIQRNSLVVGFVMGFAIIPIIYTISEDALSAVPEHLRSASLGAGATPWQTATRIIIPTAMSGLFSAVMIGLGRAVGETMIVLMAAGNTPIMEWNIFNGFRTLSANIAVELPEAVVNSTHYRTLFLAALMLFFMTFVLNTVAEIVRLRFRKRASEL